MNHHGHEELSAFLNRLQGTKVDQYIDLPSIVVLGDTSSGKSSLLSQISGVELPCSHELTTKCPIELALVPSQQPSSGDNDNTSSEEKRLTTDVQSARIQIQWRSTEPQSKEVSFDTTLSQDEWDSIPATILRAQELILNETDKPVATDVVQVTIRGPRIQHPLNLVDLPGLVRSTTGQERADIVSGIDDLVKRYIHNPRCVILAVLPANVDVHNSRLAELHAQLSQDDERSNNISPSKLNGSQSTSKQRQRRKPAILPVLTKPDLIDPGAESAITDLLLGRILLPDTYPHGLHMIKSRGQAALDANVTLANALSDEATYFESTPPWSDLDPSYLGTPALAIKLSRLQLQIMRDSLPDVVDEIRQQHKQATTALTKMGGPPHIATADKRRYYQDVSQKLISQLSACLSGKRGSSQHSRHTDSVSEDKERSHNGHHPYGSDGFTSCGSSSPTTKKSNQSGAAALHEACSQFMEGIRQGSLATMRTITDGAHVLVSYNGSAVRGEVVHLDDKFGCVDFLDDADRQSDSALFDMVGLQVSSSADTKLERDDVWSDGTKVYIARDELTFDAMRKIPLTEIRTDPSWLQARIADNRTDDLPCFLNVDIFKNIVREFIDEDWKPYCFSLLQQTRTIVQDAISDAIATSCRSHSNDNMKSKDDTSYQRYPKLTSHMESVCRKAADDLLTTAKSQIEAHLNVEKAHPYTQDAVLFERINATRHERLRKDLTAALRLDQPDRNAVYDVQAIRSRVDSVFAHHAEQSPDEYMAEEMEIVLESYGRIATRRVIDRTPMVCWEVFRSLTHNVQQALWTVTDETLKSCTPAAPGFAEKYQSLSNQVEELEMALEVASTMY